MILMYYFFYQLCLLPEVLQHDDQHVGEQCTARHTLKPLRPIEEVEGLDGEEEQAVGHHHDERIPKVGRTYGAYGRSQVVGTIARYEHLEQIGLYQSHHRHGGSRHARCIGKDVHAESQGEATQQHRPPWVVAAEMEHQDDVEQWGSTAKQVDMVEHQSLRQQEYHEGCQALYQFYTHFLKICISYLYVVNCLPGA